MELIVDSESQSLTAKIINEYSRSNVKIVELSNQSRKHLGISLPLLSKDQPLKYPLSIYTELTNISNTSSLLYGETPLERAQTSSWIELGNLVASDVFIDYLEKKLLSRTFLVSNHITLADIYAFVIVRENIGGLTLSEKNKFPSVMRWAAHIMSLPGLKNILPLFEIPHRINKIKENFENLINQNNKN